MERKLIQFFKKAKTVKALNPGADFAERSKNLILNSGAEAAGETHRIAGFKNGWLPGFRFRAALVLGGVLAAAALIFFAAGLNDNKENAAAVKDNLNSEIENLDFRIQIGEAQYFSRSAEEIAVLLGSLENSGITD